MKFSDRIVTTVEALVLSSLAYTAEPLPLAGPPLHGGGPEVMEIPITLQNDLAPILTVEIGDTRVRLRFDLGDRTPLVLQKSVLDAAHAVPTGTYANAIGLDGPFKAPFYKVARVQLGTAVFTDVVARLDMPRRGYVPDKKTQGYIGTALLKPYRIVIDYPHRVLTLLRGEGQSALCRGTRVPFDLSSPMWRGEPMTAAQTDFGRVLLAWDTGSFTSVIRKAAVPSAHLGPVTTEKLILGGRNFGPRQLRVFDVSLPGFDGFIGNDFFDQNVVCVDFPDNELRLP